MTHEVIAQLKKAYYAGYEECEKGDANCFTGWREWASQLQSTQEGGTEYGSKMVKAVEKFLKEEPEEAKRLWNEVESMRLGEPEEEGGTLEAEEVLDKFVFFPQYIKDDVIPAMTEYASQVSANDKKRIEELEKEVERLRG